jgi:hypothetical protein
MGGDETTSRGFTSCTRSIREKGSDSRESAWFGSDWSSAIIRRIDARISSIEGSWERSGTTLAC